MGCLGGPRGRMWEGDVPPPMWSVELPLPNLGKIYTQADMVCVGKRISDATEFFSLIEAQMLMNDITPIIKYSTCLAW